MHYTDLTTHYCWHYITLRTACLTSSAKKVHQGIYAVLGHVLQPLPNLILPWNMHHISYGPNLASARGDSSLAGGGRV